MWASPVTAASWIIASLPIPVYLVWVAVTAIAVAELGATGALLALLVPMLGLLASVVLALRDRTALRGRGVPAPAHPALILLASPIVYLAVRAARVRRAGGRAIGPVILGSISAALVLVVVAVGTVAGMSQAVSGVSALDAGHGAYDASGAARVGTTPTRTDVGKYVTSTEARKDGADVYVNCGFGVLGQGSTIHCVSRTPGTFTPLQESIVVHLEGTRITGYERGIIDPRAAERVGSPSHPSCGCVPMEVVVPTVAVGPIGADGIGTGSGSPTSADVEAFEGATLQAAGLDWDLETQNPSGSVFARYGTVKSLYSDAEGRRWHVEDHVDVEGGRYRVWVYAETA